MDKRHEEYVEYYRARLKKLEGNPLYKNSYGAEKAVFDAISTAGDLDEFKARLDAGNLAVKCAIALIRDQETARMKLYEEIHEPVKAKGCAQILAVIDSFANVMDLVTAVNNLRQKNSLEQTVDLFAGNFYSDFLFLENIEVRAKAEVPERWRADQQKVIDETLEHGRTNYRDNVRMRAREWDPRWEMNHDLVWEERHRRLIPVPDESVKRRIAEHKHFLGV